MLWIWIYVQRKRFTCTQINKLEERNEKKKDRNCFYLAQSGFASLEELYDFECLEYLGVSIFVLGSNFLIHLCCFFVWWLIILVSPLLRPTVGFQDLLAGWTFLLSCMKVHRSSCRSRGRNLRKWSVKLITSCCHGYCQQLHEDKEGREKSRREGGGGGRRRREAWCTARSSGCSWSR